MSFEADYFKAMRSELLLIERLRAKTINRQALLDWTKLLLTSMRGSHGICEHYVPFL